MSAVTPAATHTEADFQVADLSLADFGRKEITLAEYEMPGLMAMRREYADDQPLKGARITGSLHMTIQTAVLIETLMQLGAAARWSSCNIRTMPPPRSPRAASRSSPGRVRPRTKYEWCIEQTLRGSKGWTPNVVLDDGGDAIKILHGRYPDLLAGSATPRKRQRSGSTGSTR